MVKSVHCDARFDVLGPFIGNDIFWNLAQITSRFRADFPGDRTAGGLPIAAVW